MKGISPLIATVLLVSFVISVGVIFSNWITPFFGKQTADISDKQDTFIKCSGAKIFFEKDSFKANGTRLSLIAENRGNVNLTDIQIYVTLNDSSFIPFTSATNYNTVLQPSQMVQLFNNSDINKTNVTKVSIVTGPGAACTSIKWDAEFT